MSIFLYLNKIYIPFYVIFLLAALFASIISYRRRKEELTRLYLATLIILRTFVYFLLLSAFFFLIIELRFSTKEKPTVFVLLDASGSMDMKVDGISRKTEALQFYKDRIIPSLEKKANIRFFLFSDRIYPSPDSMDINKGTTMIGNVLKQASVMKEKPPSAVFLISDGRNTAGVEPLEIVERLPFPVFSFKVGRSLKESNIKIESIRVNPIVYINDTIPVTVIINSYFMPRKDITIEIKKSGKVLSKKKISSVKEGIDYPVRLTFVADKAGIQNYEINIVPFEDESNREDNKRNFAVKVLKKRKNVVLLTYQLNWDYRFLRDFLITQDDLEPTCFAKIGNRQYLIQKDKKEKKGNLITETILNADILILINPETIEQNLFSRITSRVSHEGMGLLIIGNKLPDFSEFRNVYPFVTSRDPLTGDFEPIFVKSGLITPIFKIDEHSTQTLPPLSNPLRIKIVKPVTEVFLEAKKGDMDNIPLFGSLNYGKGKIAAFTAENIWHWKMLSLSTGMNSSTYEEIMNNILKWLAVRKEEERVVLYVQKTRFLSGEPITLSAALYDEMMQPVEGGIIGINLKKGKETIEDFLMNDVGEGNYEKTITVFESGKYTLQAGVNLPKGYENKPTLQFEIESQEIEKLNFEPNHLLLDNISDISGGKSITLEGEELDNLKLKPFLLLTKKKLHFGNSLFIVLLISSFFITELFLRKMKGLK